MMYVNSRVARGVLVAAGATALLAGCGYQSEAGQASAPVTETVPAEPSTEDAPEEAPEEPATGDPAPCTTDVVEPEMALGDHSQPDAWNSAVVLTNVGTVDCRLEGATDLTFIAPSGDSYDLPTENGEPGDDLVLVAPGEQASLLFSYASAADGAAPEECSSPDSAVVTLPGDEQPLEVWHPESLDAMPALCDGPVSVSGWSAGGWA